MIHSFLFHFSNPFLSWEEVLVEVCTWNSTSLRSAYSICMRISRARIYNNVPPSPSFHPPFQNYVLQHSYQSAIYEIVSKKFRKKDRYVWSEWIYRLLLHPLTKRRSALKLTFWQKRRRNSNVFLFFCLNSDQEYSILKEKRKKLPETFGSNA